MAKATFTDGLANLRTLKLAHSAAVEAYEVIVSGGNALAAVNDADADAEDIYVFEGKGLYPKGSGAIAAGIAIYWDAVAGQMTATSSGNTRAGITAEAALSGDAEVLVFLRPN